MWPRLLLDLLPHFARLLPAADKYLANRSASDKALETAMAALAGDVRGELRHVTEEQAGIRSQLQEHGAQVAQMAAEVARLRTGTESLEERFAKLEKTAATVTRLAWVALVLLVGVSALLVVLVLRLKAH